MPVLPDPFSKGLARARLTTAGVLRDEMRSGRTYNGQCQGGADPGGDWYSFNGIFMLHLAYFTEITAEKNALSNATLQQIKTFVQRTSDSAWNNSAVWPWILYTHMDRKQPIGLMFPSALRITD